MGTVGVGYRQYYYMLKKSLYALLIAGCLSTGIYSQTTGAGTITGTITDPSGGIIPSAGVVVRNTATQTDRNLTTNEAGIFVAQFLQPQAASPGACSIC